MTQYKMKRRRKNRNEIGIEWKGTNNTNFGIVSDMYHTLLSVKKDKENIDIVRSKYF